MPFGRKAWSLISPFICLERGMERDKERQKVRGVAVVGLGGHGLRMGRDKNTELATVYWVSTKIGGCIGGCRGWQ